jgi:hypothetical protein
LQKSPQLKLGELPIADIKINLKSRGNIPPLLLGLQYIYTNLELRSQVSAILKEVLSPGTDRNNERPGMKQWKIFLLGVLRLNLNCDYDRIHELANNHKIIRQMLCEYLERNILKIFKQMKTDVANCLTIALLLPQYLFL